MIYDLIIIGAGPAGVSAAIYAKRAGLKVLSIDSSMVGGYLNFIDKIDNYPGVYQVTGPDLAFQMLNQMKSLEIEMVNKKVIDIIDGSIKKVVTSDNEYETKYVLIATGRVSRKLGLEHEDELLGKGISHCAMCDGYFYKNKDVAVLGGGDSALQEALYLSGICRNVYLIHRRDKFTAAEDIVKKVLEKENIIKVMNSVVTKLELEEDHLNGLLLNNHKNLEVSCLFSYIGYVPGTKFATNLDITDKDGYIEVDNNGETKIKGIFAAGDIVKKQVYQIVTAVSEGAISVLEIERRLKQEK